MTQAARPTRAQLESARDKLLRDVIAPDLNVLFVGINPGLYSAAIGHNFGRPGNRFWPTLARSGFTDRQLAPYEETQLLGYGLGITNLCARTTARADELAPQELIAGVDTLARKVLRYRPRVVAVLGVTAYRTAWQRSKGQLGPADAPFAGARLWVLPNPSGLNAHHQLADLASLFAALRATL